MTRDIVERLRHPEPVVRGNAVFDAAREIERLREELRAMTAWADRLEKQHEELSSIINKMVMLTQQPLSRNAEDSFFLTTPKRQCERCKPGEGCNADG